MHLVQIASLRYRSGQAVAFNGVYAERSEVFRLLAMTVIARGRAPALPVFSYQELTLQASSI